MEHILDLEPQEPKRSPLKIFSVIEIILGGCFVICLTAYDAVGIRSIEGGVLIVGTVLALFYIVANWWADKPLEVTVRTVFITILYGLASGNFVFALLFQTFHLTGSWEMTIVAFAFLVIVVLLDLLFSIGKRRVLRRWAAYRLAILCVMLVIYQAT